MANWQRKLNLKDVWNKSTEDGDMTVQELAGVISKRLKALRPLGDDGVDVERDEIADEFEGLSEDPDADTNDFDNVMASLYDWGDMALDNNWPPKKVCWIATDF